MKQKAFLLICTFLMAVSLLLTVSNSSRVPEVPAVTASQDAASQPEEQPGEQPEEPAPSQQPEEPAVLPEGAVLTDYADPENWLVWEEGGDKPADLFFVAPTTDMGRDGNFNMVLNEKWRGRLMGCYLQEKGLYEEVCNAYSPYYQQITFPVYSMEPEEAAPYVALAYSDVRNAFAYYLEHSDPQRPLILAGFSQGSQHLISLMKEFFGDEALQKRLVAFYCIGWKITEEDLAACPALKMAQAEDDTGVVVAFTSEAEGVTGSLIIPEGTTTYGINPLNWMTDSTPADAALNLGACFTDYEGNITKEIPQLTGAYRDETRGALIVPDVTPEDYPGKPFADGVYHLYDYQFFFRNLQQNVRVRLERYQAEQN